MVRVSLGVGLLRRGEITGCRESRCYRFISVGVAPILRQFKGNYWWHLELQPNNIYTGIMTLGTFTWLSFKIHIQHLTQILKLKQGFLYGIKGYLSFLNGKTTVQSTLLSVLYYGDHLCCHVASSSLQQ